MNIDIPDNENEENECICDMQERLNTDTEGKYKDELIAFFSNWYDKFNDKLNSGLSPEDYNKYKKLLECTGIAGGVITGYWTTLHESD